MKLMILVLIICGISTTDGKKDINKFDIDLEKALADPEPVPQQTHHASSPLFSSKTIGYWGKWGSKQFCPTGQYVHGFRLKSEKSQGRSGDDTGLNGIQLYCRGGSSITSKTERWGKWMAKKSCKGSEPVTGFQIRIEKDQGWRGDDTAANDVNFWCKGGYYIHGSAATRWGSWSGLLKCPEGKAVVGLQTRVEEPCGRSCDDTALNGVKMFCAYLPVNGGWSSWNSWSTCTRTCGQSERSRRRQCNNPMPKYGGEGCEGDDVEVESCKLPPCFAILNKGQCTKGTVSRTQCAAIAKLRGLELEKIINPDRRHFPRGCYRKKGVAFYFNVFKSTAKCSDRRSCVCKA